MTDKEAEARVPSQLAHSVRLVRRERGWSKEKAAREAGISSITWKRVEDDLPVQEAKLGAIGTALGWPEGYVYKLKSDIPSVGLPVDAEPYAAHGARDLRDVELNALLAEVARRARDNNPEAR